MTLLNAWVLFGLIPLYYIYKKHSAQQNSRQIHLLYLALFFMFLAMARPALKNALNNEKFNSQDFIIALDASYSMMADDIKPNRYEAAKKVIKKLVQKHPKDRFTIFAFTSNALLISPPTTDTAISMQALDALNPKYILTKSTSLYSLFKTIAKTSFKKKNLLIFSDGGDEHDIATLVNIAKKNNITPYIVATASQHGAALKKDGKYLKNIHGSLVVSKINPILRDLAVLSGGKYYELTDTNIVEKLSKDITKTAQTKKQNIKVQSYNELFYIPLFIALVLFFLSVTKLHQLYLFVPLLFILPHKANANILDFHYLKNAQQNYQEKRYKEAAKNFTSMEPSVRTYYNSGVAYYKAKEYKNALRYFSQIKTGNKIIKQKIFYNMGNCALRLQHYDKAKQLYLQALGLGYDSDAFYNLNLLRKLHLKSEKELAKSISHKNNPKKKSADKNKKESSKQKKTGNSKSSKRSSNQSTNGKGSDKKKQKSSTLVKLKHKQNNYKMGYKAYELINKGYTDEKEPW